MPERYIGQTLGKYRIDELIGSGGFAWVYRGFDPELEIPVALKVLKPQFAGDKTFEERFRREASTAAKLRHPNIIKIYAVGRDGEAVYFVMDYLPTGLADRLETTPSLPEEFVIRMGVDVSRALGFAHREGVIHRDIKVDNILFDTHGNAVVADFGIARAVSGYTNQTGTNMVVGTPQYFAPEQARAKALDGRADIYSLGVSLFRTVTGRLPFEGDDWYEIARQHVEEPAPSARSFNPAVSPALDRLLSRCLAKHPDDRPATGEQLADELTVALQSLAESHATGRATYQAPSETPTLITPAHAAVKLATGRARSRRLMPAAVAAGGAVLAIVIALAARAGRDAAATPNANGDSVPVVSGPADSAGSTDPRLPVGPVAPTTDTLAGAVDSSRLPADTARGATRRDTLRGKPPVALTGGLVVAAPPNARVSVNGQAMSDGAWRADTLKPGDYVLGATVPAIAGCESASVEERVRVRSGASRTVTLQPRACGTLDISARNAAAGARYSLTSTDGAIKKEGSFPLNGGIVLPAGNYSIRVSQAQCALFEQSDIRIVADSRTSLPFSLLCGS